MITLYTGTPGSGKSLYACSKILDALMADKLVITNYPVTLDNLSRFRLHWLRGMLGVLQNKDMSPGKLAELSRAYWQDKPIKEGRILLVIDEAGTVFNPRDWSAPDRKDWLTFFAQHRKLGFDVILIAQSDMQLDKQIRPCVEVEQRFRCSKQFLPWVPFRLFLWTSYYYNQQKTKNYRLHSELFRFHRAWASIYDTMAIFGPSVPALPAPTERPKRKGRKYDR
jgi:zona occludens toxin